MNDLAADRAIKNDTEELVGYIARRWPKSHMNVIQDDMQYGQYAEAVLDIVSISYKENIQLRKKEILKIRGLIDRMEIGGDVKRLIKRLTEYDPQSIVDDSEATAAFLSR